MTTPQASVVPLKESSIQLKEARTMEQINDESTVASSTTPPMTSLHSYNVITTPKTIASGIQTSTQPSQAFGEESEERGETVLEKNSAEDLMHGINSFWALISPVALTMLLARYVQGARDR